MYIACTIKDQLLIKVLSMVRNTQKHNNLAYQQSIPFIPLYLDEDYKYLENKEKWRAGKAAGDNSKGAKEDDSEDFGKLMVLALQTYSTVKKYEKKGVRIYNFTSNAQMAQLLRTAGRLAQDPARIWKALQRLPPSEQKERYSHVLQVLRGMQNLFLKQTDRLVLKSINQALHFDGFCLLRSDHYCYNFTCSHRPERLLVASHIGRHVHVNDAVTGRTLFEIR